MANIKVGDEVRIFDVNGRRVGQPEGGWPGKVVKIGRKLVHIEYGEYGTKTETFRLDGATRIDNYGHRYYRTLAEVALNERRNAALAVLKQHGIELKFGHDLKLEQIEALAKVAETFR